MTGVRLLNLLAINYLFSLATHSVAAERVEGSLGCLLPVSANLAENTRSLMQRPEFADWASRLPLMEREALPSAALFDESSASGAVASFKVESAREGLSVASPPFSTEVKL
jgi:hypothetical protein